MKCVFDFFLNLYIERPESNKCQTLSPWNLLLEKIQGEHGERSGFSGDGGEVDKINWFSGGEKMISSCEE